MDARTHGKPISGYSLANDSHQPRGEGVVGSDCPGTPGSLPGFVRIQPDKDDIPSSLFPKKKVSRSCCMPGSWCLGHEGFLIVLFGLPKLSAVASGEKFAFPASLGEQFLSKKSAFQQLFEYVGKMGCPQHFLFP
eukprot:EG_transcript_10780